jgi:hypothetical protein
VKLRIVNRSGLGMATQLFNADTGEEISLRYVRRIEIVIDGKGPTRAVIEFANVEIDTVSDGKDVSGS